MADATALRCKVQHYDWGRKGEDSLIYHLTGDSYPEKETPFAELWMGTHPNGPSYIKNTEQTLKDWICANERDTTRDIEGNLPFLFKVLSIRIPLSVQAHPDKTLAEKLHKEYPNIYRDPNHKPELVLALSDDFEALCCFRSFSEIAYNVTHCPELALILEADTLATVSEHLANPPCDATASSLVKAMFQQVMFASPSVVLQQTSALISRLSANLANGRNQLEPSSDQEELEKIERVILRVNEEFPNDVGLFCFYFLNYVKLAKGEGLFMGANEPHAYIRGNCLEAQACSDNVVRAGLTPKYRDCETLCSMLTYRLGCSPILLGDPIDENTKLYFNSAIDDFALLSITIAKNTIYTLPLLSAPMIFLILSGSGELLLDNGEQSSLSFGSTFYLVPNCAARISATSDLEIYACTSGTVTKQLIQ